MKNFLIKAVNLIIGFKCQFYNIPPAITSKKSCTWHSIQEGLHSSQHISKSQENVKAQKC